MSSKRVAALAALACFCWSTAFVGIKVGLQYLPPLRFAGMRFALSGLILMPFWLTRNHPPFRKIRWGALTLLAFFQTFLLYGLLYLGMTKIPGSLTAILVGSSPLFAALIAHFLMPNDRLTLVKVVALLLGVAGVVFVTLSRRPWGPVGWSEMPGVIMVLGACASSAIGNVIVTKVRKDFPPVFLNSCQIFLGGLGLLVVSFLFEENRSIPVAPGFYLSLGWLTILSAGAFSLWFFLLQLPNASVSGLNVWKFIIPVAGAILSWALLPSESASAGLIVGMIVIAGAIILFNMNRSVTSPAEGPKP